MKRLILALALILAVSSQAFATAYTATQTGNLSSASTWGGGGSPNCAGGDTISLGAFTVTVDVNCAIGTSPNNTTTKVIDLTSASSVLKVATGVTLTVLGNRGAVNGSTFQQEAGSTVTFDASASGGSPVYTDVNVGFTKYIFNGSAGNPATIQAVAGRTFVMNSAWSLFTATYIVVRRQSGLTVSSISGNVSISDGVFDSCGMVRLTINNGSINAIFDRNEFVSPTDASSPPISFRLDGTTAYVTGTRRVTGNKLDGDFTYNSIQFSITNNYFGQGFSFGNTGRATAFSGNLANQTIARANSLQYYGTTTVSGNYFAYGTGGNAHFLDARAAGGDLTVSGNVFEQTSTYSVDVGDAVFPWSDGSARTITVDNNIVLPISFAGDTATSGTIITGYGTDATRTIKARHNTIAGANPAGTAAVNVAEGGVGHAGELAEWKSNLIWSAATSTQHSASRISGTTNGVITASGADYNFRWNVNIGDNGRGYDDVGGNLNLWTGAAATTGAAAASNVDDHGVVANPGFVDPTRNLATWSAYRGGAATTTAALAAVRNDPTLTGTSLIPWVTAGFAPTNPAYQGTAHDGTTPGAVPGVFFPALLIAP